MKLSRRTMFTLAGAGAIASAAAQTPAPQNEPKPDPLTKAREDNRQSAENLTKFEIPMSTEPSFIFRP
jgi:hypothetical protein